MPKNFFFVIGISAIAKILHAIDTIIGQTILAGISKRNIRKKLDSPRRKRGPLWPTCLDKETEMVI
jgi:hypothetical protein